MAVKPTDFSKHDQEIWDEELQDFIPDRVFDAHVHLFNPVHLPEAIREKHAWGYTDLATMQQWAERLYPGRETHFLSLGTPIAGIDVAAHNEWCIQQINLDPNSRMNRLVTPSCSVQQIERDIREKGFIGLKPYRVFSVTGDIAQCRIEEFLPHEQLELANELGLWVTMHLSRFHGCGDEENLKDLQEYTCRRYPKVKWILAHCARSFTYWPIRKAIEQLREMPNIWYDVSAVTDVRPMITLFTREDRRRIFYGSDGVDATYFRGQYAALGRAWQYVDTDQLDIKFPHCDGRPILAVYEQLLSIKHAAEIAQWSRDDIEHLFWKNAAAAFQIRFSGDTSAISGEAGSQTQEVYQRAKLRIPGGTQLLSKRPEMFAPGRWPAYAREAKGCEVIDLDGRRYIDMTTSGIGACLLGYADPDVTQAVQQRIARGSMSSLNSAEEVELADLLVELHPWAEQVRYARSGGESMAIAVRIARAATSRDKIAFCGYHGWSDWYLAANVTPGGPNDGLGAHLLPGLAPNGVPRGLAGTALPFTYNRLDELEDLVRKHGDQLAAVVMEPTRSHDPAPGFLEGVRDLCHRCGAALVFDEISSGWRMHLGGAHLKYGVFPDLAVFAKAIGNGHPMAAIIGRREVMDAAQTSFISSTYWTEGVGPTAALATIKKLRRVDIASHTTRMGGLVRDGWRSLGERTGVPVKVSGHPALLHVGFEHEQAAGLGTLLTARMLDRGFLCGGGYYPSFAHRERHLEAYFAALEPVFGELAETIERGDVTRRLQEAGVSVRHSGFARLS
ncbi:aminotransferase class III-fold pyridoxal phosphate-dependent enzyme [Schlesneria sp. T3-172]|uniref:aminotransferase class III-fold pyridoxal phosphate-dependent enzyme n=1 Tax=Schlesneria sphaerica TaxID=3373610 RepID=UPI0037C9D21A